VYWTKYALQAGRSHPERVHIHLADDYSAGILQSLDADGVYSRDAILERLERSGCRDAGRVVEVLDADGDAVEGAAPSSALDLLVRLAGLIESLIRQDCGKRVQPRVQRVDSLQAALDDARRRHVTRSNTVLEFFDAQVVGVVFHLDVGSEEQS
jgi:hypothetical protein